MHDNIFWSFTSFGLFEPAVSSFVRVSQLQGSQLEVKDILRKCFSAMRNSIDDMLPWGWDLADNQSLAGVDITQLEAKEEEYFVCLGPNVYSKDFAVKSQAMKDLSTRKVNNK